MKLYSVTLEPIVGFSIGIEFVSGQELDEDGWYIILDLAIIRVLINKF